MAEAVLWQERAPHGSWFVRKADGRNVCFGSDKADGEEFCTALNSHDASDLLRIIARGVDIGHTGRLHTLLRNELMARARDYCDQHGLSYAISDLQVERSDSPASMARRNALARIDAGAT